MEYEEISNLAVKKGAKFSKILNIKQVVISDWVYWKCKFGCNNYGMNLTCPPNSPSPSETREILKGYNYAILLKYDSSQDYNGLLSDLEREAFLGGLYSAWGLTAGSCRLCEKCLNEVGKCPHVSKIRPSMEACGIDVFATAQNAGLDLKVLNSKDDDYPRICLLLLK